MTDRHGCYNRKPFADGYESLDGYKVSDSSSGLTAQARLMLVKMNMSRDCRHTERATDPRCAGCKWVTMTDEQVRAQS